MRRAVAAFLNPTIMSLSLLIQFLLAVLAIVGFVGVLMSLEEGAPGRALLSAAYFFIFMGYGAVLEAAVVFLFRDWSGLDAVLLLPPAFVAGVLLPVFAIALFRYRHEGLLYSVALVLSALYGLLFAVRGLA